MPNSNTFEWRNLTRESIIEHLKLLKKQIVNNSVTFDQLYIIISKHLKIVYPLLTVKQVKVSACPDTISIGGCYYPTSDQNGKKCIQLIFQKNPINDTFVLTGKMFKCVMYLIADTIMHEIIHMYQYRKRKFLPLSHCKMYAVSNLIGKQQQYYGQHDEMYAHAFNVLYEVLDKTRKELSEFNILNSKILNKSSTYRTYVETFGTAHTILTILKSKVLEHYRLTMKN